MTWRESAACLGVDPDIFFVDVGKPTKQAKSICGSCPVSAECLDYAVTTMQAFGVWGGVGRRQRQVIRSGGGLEHWDPCTVTTCDRPQVAKELCDTHYRVFMRHGDPNVSAPSGRPPSVSEDQLRDSWHLSPQQAAIRLRVSPQTIRRHRKRLLEDA